MVATDLAARGFDVPGLSHVVNFDLPTSTEIFVHRIGRTGRAGNSGEAFSFCDQNSKHLQENIDISISPKPEVFPWHPFHSEKIENMSAIESLEKANKNRQRKEEDKGKEKVKEKKIIQPVKKAIKVQTKTGNKVKGRKPKITGKGRQKSNRPSNKLQKKRGKRH